MISTARHRSICLLITPLALALAACSNATDMGADGGAGGGATFASIYASSEFQKCAGCHAPNAPGKVDGTEATEDWSTQASAYRSLHGMASGLIGNFAGCNGAPLIAASADASLLVAAFDADVRMNFMSSAAPDCNADAISDQTLKLGGPLPDALLKNLKDWINAGAPE